jgi:hypothetical protein
LDLVTEILDAFADLFDGRAADAKYGKRRDTEER